MAQSFGARMRQQREDRGVDLIAISEQTKIKQSLLDALERDDVSHWPSGIFRRAFVRAYAEAIGLDPDPVVREFLELFPEPSDVVAEAVSALGLDEKKSGSARLRTMMGSALESLKGLRRPGPEQQAPVQQVTVFAPPPAIAPERESPEVAEPAAAAPRAEAAMAIADPPPAPVEMIPEPPVVAPPVFDEPVAYGEGAPVAMPAAAVAPPPPVPEPRTLDVVALADLVTALGRIDNRPELQPLLRNAAGVLDATGVIVWIWDEMVEQLRAALAHGYSDKVLAHVPSVGRDEDNATAAAFRSAAPCLMAGAMVAPMLTPDGCRGVLAIEFRDGADPDPGQRAAATILAAAFAQLVQRARPVEAQPPVERFVAAEPARAFASSRPMRVRR